MPIINVFTYTARLILKEKFHGISTHRPKFAINNEIERSEEGVTRDDMSQTYLLSSVKIVQKQTIKYRSHDATSTHVHREMARGSHVYTPLCMPRLLFNA